MDISGSESMEKKYMVGKLQESERRRKGNGLC